MSKFFVAVALVLAMILGLGVGVTLSHEGVIAPPEVRVVRVTDHVTTERQPIINNKTFPTKETVREVRVPCDLPDTGGQHLDRHKAH